jgi:hypothetical protein
MKKSDHKDVVGNAAIAKDNSKHRTNDWVNTATTPTN